MRQMLIFVRRNRENNHAIKRTKNRRKRGYRKGAGARRFPQAYCGNGLREGQDRGGTAQRSATRPGKI